MRLDREASALARRSGSAAMSSASCCALLRCVKDVSSVPLVSVLAGLAAEGLEPFRGEEGMVCGKGRNDRRCVGRYEWTDSRYCVALKRNKSSIGWLAWMRK